MEGRRGGGYIKGRGERERETVRMGRDGRQGGIPSSALRYLML